MKILLVDDDATNRLVLNAYLKKDGHETLVAENGQQAVEIFQAEKPDMVLMDVMMPVMDGYEATAKIKELADSFIPIIFLTAMTDEKALSKCVTVGGDDFLTKPYSRAILNAKIEALDRVRQLYNTVYAQNQELENYKIQLEQEQKIARNVYNSLINSGCLDVEIFHTHLSPVSLFNGDVVLAAFKPSGGFNLLFGDFTGHGLAAALGVLPLSETFYAMTAKNYGIEDLSKEINNKLKQQLPTGVFLAACMVEVDVSNHVIKVWNGAIPGAYLIRKSGELKPLVSRHLPFGILSNKEFSNEIEIVEIYDGDRLVLSTDGILEAENTAGEMYGTQRFEQSILKYVDQHDLIASMIADLNQFTQEQQANDDITLAVIDLDFDFIEQYTQSNFDSVQTLFSNWCFEMRLYYDTLQQTDPLPIINQVLTAFLGKTEKEVQINMSLTEMYCNALDHGLLELDSAIKATPQGFIEFYELKNKRLKELKDGYIIIHLKNKKVSENSSLLTITMEDSGKGFDVSKLEAESRLDGNRGFSGRGYPLIKHYSESVSYNEKGNKIECVFKIE